MYRRLGAAVPPAGNASRGNLFADRLAALRFDEMGSAAGTARDLDRRLLVVILDGAIGRERLNRVTGYRATEEKRVHR